MTEQKRLTELEQFREFYGKYALSQQVSGDLNSDNANNRTSARRHLRMGLGLRLGIDDHIVPATEAYDAQATAEEMANGRTLQGYFTENKNSIIDALPRLSLESIALEIAPIEFPTNRHYSPEHNSLVGIHREYLGIRGLNQGFVAKKVPYADYTQHMSQIAAGKIVEEMSKNKYLDKKTIGLFAAARAQLVGSSEIAALHVGRQVETETKEKFMSKAKELANPAENNMDRRYTLANYAANNIRYNPKIEQSMAYTHAVLKVGEEE